MSEDLPFLDELAEARIKAVSCEAESHLSRDVMDFLFSCAADDLAKLGHVPTSYDLLPFFVQYAGAVFDAEAGEYLKDLKMPAERSFAIRKLHDVAVSVRRTITRKRDGVWRRVVDLAIDYAGGSHETKLGYWDRTFFRTPLWTALKLALTVRAKLWESKLYDSFSTKEKLPVPGTQSQGNQPQSPGIKPGNGDSGSEQVQLADGSKPTIVENLAQVHTSAVPANTALPKDPQKAKRQKKEACANPEAIFDKYTDSVPYEIAEEVLSVRRRRIQELVKEEKLVRTGPAHRPRVTTASLKNLFYRVKK